MDLKNGMNALSQRIDQLDSVEKASVLHGLMGWFQATASLGEMAEPQEVRHAEAFVTAMSVALNNLED